MQIRPHIELDPKRGLLIGGIPAEKLASKYGTPLYVYSEDAIRDAMREYSSALGEAYPNSAVAYASKAYLTMRMAELVSEEGLWIDVATGGELFVALQAGFPPERIILHGNSKSSEEIAMAVNAGVGRIVIDNTAEIERVQSAARARGITQKVFLRLTPGIDAHTHRYLSTGEIDSKFGIPMHTGQHLAAVRMTIEAPNLELKGIHCHIGSQIFEGSPFELAAHIMVDFMAEVRDRLGYVIPELDLGGGLGVKYRGPYEGSGIAEHMRRLGSVVKERALSHSLPLPRLFVEPGRSLVAAAAVTLYSVGTVKTLPNGTIVAAIDGGISDNPRPVLYGAEYEAILARPSDDPELYEYRIVGKHCEEGDTLIKNVKLPKLSTGDVLAVPVSGAYQYSMRSNYNLLTNPAVVHVAEGHSFVVVQRQTYMDLIAKERPVRQCARRNDHKAADAD